MRPKHPLILVATLVLLLSIGGTQSGVAQENPGLPILTQVGQPENPVSTTITWPDGESWSVKGGGSCDNWGYCLKPGEICVLFPEVQRYDHNGPGGSDKGAWKCVDYYDAFQCTHLDDGRLVCEPPVVP